jgi:hypothetical protein
MSSESVNAVSQQTESLPDVNSQQSMTPDAGNNQPDVRFKIAREEGEKRGYQKAVKELSAQNQSQGQSQNSGEDISSLVDQKVQERIKAEEDKRLKAQHEEYAAKTWGELSSKAADAKSRYSDFDTVVGKDLGNFSQAPDIMLLANTVPNSGDVLYELAKNPAKIGLIRAAPANFQASLIKQLSDSITQNQSSSNAQVPKEPLTHVNPSSTGMSSGKGRMSLQDLKKVYIK